ncbi:MAG: hypothetical protein WCL71_14720 [Deltaproteobacteria bacterium]
MQPWQYCTITCSGGVGDERWCLVALEPSGPLKKTEDISEDEMFALIGKLGKEGWEMCGCASYGQFRQTIYFKRAR